jgi:hypothetical protein
MAMLAEVSLGGELVKEVVSAGATAVFVTLFGGLVIGALTKRSDVRRRDYEVRSQLLERCNRVAGEMFMSCQTASRALRDAPPEAESMERLDDEYFRFQVEQGVLENELGSRFGFKLIPPETAIDQVPPGYVQARWHQVADLLTMYYFNLKNNFPGDVRENNSKGHDEKFHSGLGFTSYEVPLDDAGKREVGLREMRQDIRRTYRAALRDLVQSLLSAPLAKNAVGASVANVTASPAA